MSENKIPAADYAVVGGSGTLSSNFPANVPDEDVEILADNLRFDTPYGASPAMRLFRVGEKHVLTVKMHGWRSGVTRADASRQVFWVFREAGVKRIISEGGVGTVNKLLDLRDFIIPDDYLDMSVRKDVMLDGRYLLIMREALCPEMRQALIAATKKRFDGRVFIRGTYAVTDGRHFESPAEVAMLNGHADIVGQSICPEVYLAREIGACYAGLYFTVNYGEGIKEKWSHQDMADIFYDDAPMIGEIILETIRNVDADERNCECLSLRKETLLKDVYNEVSAKG
ncbi:putative phosphorylase superfamily protein [Selenomonas ruminantium subsp. lactilytica TAM6421]|uniref:Putative phosphorylase superfamily protein n=1 Tax=Selenomonas ruminantium subsp. lactilytica (strain NBRC 103574 / TAM6421) TaxID=927704 RepID=I0GUH3_SELRL|nr:MTAP family purine nucleoside phosphorylase [Selenomonas ruminantium]BAL84410.1 putative phosphorylase superfamily protein [Selenomonas ruminantium subsp. lactilytica TAM6421]